MADEQMTMAEIPSANGRDMEGADAPSGKAYFDRERRVFVTRAGETWDLRAIAPLLIERIYNESADKPKPPLVEVTIGGKHKTMQPDPNDAYYKQSLAEWEATRQFRIMYYLFTMGVNVDVPEYFTRAQREYFPDANETYMKYLYIASQLADGDDVGALSEAISGQTMPTQEGLREAASNFRREH